MRSRKLAKNSPERLTRHRAASSCNAPAVATFSSVFFSAEFIIPRYRYFRTMRCDKPRKTSLQKRSALIACNLRGVQRHLAFVLIDYDRNKLILFQKNSILSILVRTLDDILN